MPLSFVIARYFAYAFAAVATAWLASFMALSAAINAGFVYEASWGPANAREVAEGLARDGVCGQQDVPTAYRYLILNKDGYVLMTDLEGTRLEDATEMARTALAADPGTTPPAPRATEAATTGSASTPPPRPRAPTGAPSRSPTAPRAARWPPSRSPCEGLTTQALTPAWLATKRFPDNNARCGDRPG